MTGSDPDVLRERVAALEAENARLRAREESDREALEALRVANMRFRNAFETSFLFQGFLSLDGILLDTNSISLLAIGKDLADVVGKPFWTAPWFSPELGTPDLVRDCVRRAAGGELARVTMCENWATGPRTVELAIRLASDRDGKPDVLICEGYDKTALIEAEQKLHQSEKMSALGSLLAGIAHELNNPLAILVTQAVLLRETGTDASTIARAQKIEAAANRCAKTVKSFLAIARQRPISLAPVRLDDVVGSALDLIAYGLRSSGVILSVDTPPDLPQVRGDADQLGQLALNLIVNALQAVEKVEGPRALRIVARAMPDSVRLTFADNGPGVPDGIKSRIYDPFFTTKPVGSGTGIGLSICQSIVRQHGGSLTLQDTPGGGATFVLTLPRATQSTATPPDVADDPPGSGFARILIVDDEPEIVDMLREVIAPLASRVDCAATGLQALRLIRAHDYDLILSDLRMPDLDGPGLHSALVEQGEQKQERIVFMTGDVLDGRIGRFLDEACLPVLEKPFTPSDARRVIAAALARGQRETVPTGGRATSR
jgi:two-component system NtrC family sensor kinase